MGQKGHNRGRRRKAHYSQAVVVAIALWIQNKGSTHPVSTTIFAPERNLRSSFVISISLSEMPKLQTLVCTDEL